MSYYRKKVYDSHNGDSKLNARTGQVVEVLRELTDREADIADVGRMFHVRFADGFETDAFEDELEVHDGVKTIVDEHHSFQVVDKVPPWLCHLEHRQQYGRRISAALPGRRA